MGAPRPPGVWVDDDECGVCGERYADFRPGIQWDDAVAMLRASADQGGGYRSRGPVLWRMRVLKLSAWYGRHYVCGEYHGMGLPPEDVHACLHGESCAAMDAHLGTDDAYEPDPEWGF